MAKKTCGKKTKPNRPAAENWASLTWNDLDRWAGPRSVSRGRAYHAQGRVKDLAISVEGRLLATVAGGDRYVVSVWLKGKKGTCSLQSQCTCPVGDDGCKHAVAVVAAYLQAMADEKTLPAADADDPRWAKLSESDKDGEDEPWDEENDESEDSKDMEHQAVSKRSKRPPGSRVTLDEKIRQYIRDKSHDDLIELVLGLVDRFPELREEFQERIALGEGNVQRLVAQARRELDAVTSEIGWQNSWSGEGHTPDYSRFHHRLERLVELGHADAVAGLGREFIERAMQQVEQSHDEGDTAMAVTECLPVVFESVMKSSLPAAQKILFAIDAYLADGYDVVGDTAQPILDASWQQSDWSAVANTLGDRLKSASQRKGDDTGHNYRRDAISGWLLEALKYAGREDELLAVYEAEAGATASYERLVRYLIAQRRLDDAERWAKEGIEKTVEKLPGIAWALAEILGDLARRRKRWDIAAAHAAVRFFDRPGIDSLQELVAQAAKAKCADQVRVQAIGFLETGVSPIAQVASSKGGAALRVNSAWPLPVPEYLTPLLAGRGKEHASRRPYYDVLRDLALAEKRPEDVLRWYDQMRSGKKPSMGGWGWRGDSGADRVAEAVTKSHPERALAIYRERLDANLSQANPNAYESAAHYLQKMRPVMKALGRENDWVALLAEIREKYRNRPRFMDVLDKLEGRTVLESQKSRRHR